MGRFIAPERTLLRALSHRFELRPCQTSTGRIRRSREIWDFRSGVWTGLIKAMRLCNPMAPLRPYAWRSAYQQVLCCRSAVGVDGATSSVQCAALQRSRAVARPGRRGTLHRPLVSAPAFALEGCSREPVTAAWPLAACIPALLGGGSCCTLPTRLYVGASEPWVRPCGKSLESLGRAICVDIPAPRFPNSRGPAPHLRYRSSTLRPPPRLVSNTSLGLCQPEDPLTGPPAFAHLVFHFDTTDDLAVSPPPHSHSSSLVLASTFHASRPGIITHHHTIRSLPPPPTEAPASAPLPSAPLPPPPPPPPLRLHHLHACHLAVLAALTSCDYPCCGPLVPLLFPAPAAGEPVSPPNSCKFVVWTGRSVSLHHHNHKAFRCGCCALPARPAAFLSNGR